MSRPDPKMNLLFASKGFSKPAQLARLVLPASFDSESFSKISPSAQQCWATPLRVRPLLHQVRHPAVGHDEGELDEDERGGGDPLQRRPQDEVLRASTGRPNTLHQVNYYLLSLRIYCNHRISCNFCPGLPGTYSLVLRLKSLSTKSKNTSHFRLKSHEMKYIEDKIS